MMPIVYFLAGLPLLLGAVALSVTHAVAQLGHTTVNALVAMTSICGIGYLVWGALSKRIRGTYSYAVTQVVVSLSMILLGVNLALHSPWIWIFVGIWIGLLTVDVMNLRKTITFLNLKKSQIFSLDSLTKRLTP